ncbi:MAG: hypothetical protein H0W33_02605 [Gammaproteobacteria bacterium]|nr:hypothetical protein [Gammaproteobacteria bacterium]
MTDLAKLVVRLEAETAQYSQELDRAKRRLAVFDKQSSEMARRIGRGIGIALAGAVAGFAAMSIKAIRSADDLSKLGRSLGISTESLSQLQFAAGLSGTEIEGLSKGIARLARNASDAMRGLQTPMRAFDALDIAVKNVDGSLRGTEDLLLDVADKFSGLEDGAAKAALAQELFGRSGLDLIPLLNEGRGGIEAMKREADALGLTLSDSAGKAAEQFNDNLDRLKQSAFGASNQVVQKFLPAMAALTDRFVAFAKDSAAVDKAVGGVVTGLKLIATAAIVAKSTFASLGTVIGGTAAALARRFEDFGALDFAIPIKGMIKLARTSDDADAAAAIMREAFADASLGVTDDLETLAAMWSATLESMGETAADVDDELKDTIIFGDTAAEEAAQAAEKALQQIEGLARGLEQQIDTFGAGEEATIRYRIAQGDLAETFAAAGAAADPYRAELAALTGQYAAMQAATAAAVQELAELEALEGEGKALAASMRTALELHNDELARYDELLKRGAIDQETLTRATEASAAAYKKATTEVNKFAEEATRNVQDILASQLESGFADGLDGMLDDFAGFIRQLTAQIVAADLARRLFGAEGIGSGGGLLGALTNAFAAYGGKRDSGGRGEPGRAYMIGTGAQPEWFVPDSAGKFYPAGGVGGMQVTQHFSIQAPAGSVSLQTQTQVAAAAARGVAVANRRNN